MLVTNIYPRSYPSYPCNPLLAASRMAYYTDKAFSSQFLSNSKGLDEMIVRNKESENWSSENNSRNTGASRSLASMPRETSRTHDSSSTFTSKHNDSLRQAESDDYRHASYNSYRDPISSNSSDSSKSRFRR